MERESGVVCRGDAQRQQRHEGEEYNGTKGYTQHRQVSTCVIGGASGGRTEIKGGPSVVTKHPRNDGDEKESDVINPGSPLGWYSAT